MKPRIKSRVRAKKPTPKPKNWASVVAGIRTRLRHSKAEARELNANLENAKMQLARSETKEKEKPKTKPGKLVAKKKKLKQREPVVMATRLGKKAA